MDSSPHTNRLSREKSPYLLQHAQNPVDWYPWGEEAFSAAEAADKPVFLSIGFATCHWCHVMGKESFDSPEIAALLNDAFINVLVDREEHPEVDSIYMEIAQALMDTPGGWPLNLVLTPDKKPFFAMTYMPAKNHRGIMGMEEFIGHIKAIWNSPDRAILVEQGDKLIEILHKAKPPQGTEVPIIDHLNMAVQKLMEVADPIHGGIRGLPKFPLSYQAIFLLNYSKVHNDNRTLFLIQLTLDRMHRGGIYDHIGGGFARYSVDEHWRIPHFEKMSYDNAFLAEAYINAWRYIKDPQYRAIGEDILNYIVKDLYASEGNFYAAEDADSEGKEGLFYTWTKAEVETALSPEDAGLFENFYGVETGGNFQGRNVLFMPLTMQEFAEKKGIAVSALAEKLQEIRSALFKVRASRVHPFKDDKTLTSWNGLLMGAFAFAGFYCDNPTYVQIAKKNAQFLKKHLAADGKLLHRYRDGEAKFDAGLEDYAFLIRGLLHLFEAGQGSEWLSWAIALAEEINTHFKCRNGAFYQTTEKNAVLLRKCDLYDGSEPSANAVHTENLIRLYSITGKEAYLKQAEDVLKAAKVYIEAYPPGACYHMLSLNRYFDKKAAAIVIALNEKGEWREEIQEAFRSYFNPHRSIVWKEAGDTVLAEVAPHLQQRIPVEGKTTVYLCKGNVCAKPLSDKKEILQAIANL